MKNFKKLGLGLAALCLAFGLVFGMSAFKPKSTAVFYHYKNSTETGINLAGSWEVVDENTPAFSCSELEELPCTIEVTGDLQDYLDVKDDATKIMTSSEIRSTKGSE